MNWEGTWNLEVSTPFGKHPATLRFERDGDGSLTGHIDSRLGAAPLRDISTGGESFDATLSLELQGRTYEASINGQSDGERLDGAIKVKLPIAPPVKFTGSRAGQ